MRRIALAFLIVLRSPAAAQQAVVTRLTAATVRGTHEEIQRPRDGGRLLRSEAAYQLHLLYLWCERQPRPALALLEGLIARHPRNPHVRRAVAEVHDVYLHDFPASLRSWKGLLDAVHAGRVSEPEMAETTARLGIALQPDRFSRSDTALEHLRAVIEARPDKPF